MLLKYNADWLWHFPFSSVILFSFCFMFNYSPIKVNQFEGHFMKLQADSNYLLSKEYEVLLRCSEVLTPPVLSRISLLTFTVESEADWTWELQ